jgi:hypothetical protein
VDVSTASVCAVDRQQAVTSVLLRKLASDDAFRARLEAQPREVFAEYGLVTPDDMPATLTLAPKEQFHPIVASAFERFANDDRDPGLFCWFV